MNIRIGAVTALVVLVVVGVFMAADRTTLHLYSEEATGREDNDVDLDRLVSDVDNLTRRVDSSEADVRALTNNQVNTDVVNPLAVVNIAKNLAYRMVQENLSISDLNTGHPQVKKCTTWLINPTEGSSADCGLFSISQ